MTDFAELFDTFERRAFRFEALPAYAVAEETEALEAFMAGEPVPRGWLDEWTDFVRQSTASGKSIIRVRLIPEPLTEYFNFESTCGYPQSLEAGETILGILPQQLPLLARNVGDFWLFDGSACATLDYDAAGRFSGAYVIEESSQVESYTAIAHDLLAAARPIDELGPR